MISNGSCILGLFTEKGPAATLNRENNIDASAYHAWLTFTVQDATEKSALESKLASKSAEFDEKRKSLVLKQHIVYSSFRDDGRVAWNLQIERFSFHYAFPLLVRLVAFCVSALQHTLPPQTSRLVLCPAR